MGTRTLRWRLLRSSLLLCFLSGECRLLLSHQVSLRFDHPKLTALSFHVTDTYLTSVSFRVSQFLKGNTGRPIHAQGKLCAPCMCLKYGECWRAGAVVGGFKDMVPFVLARRVERQEPGPFRGPPSQIRLHAGPLLAPGVSGGRGCLWVCRILPLPPPHTPWQTHHHHPSCLLLLPFKHQVVALSPSIRSLEFEFCFFYFNNILLINRIVYKKEKKLVGLRKQFCHFDPFIVMRN